MLRWVLFAIPMGIAWMLLTANVSPGGFLVGFVVSLGILVLLFRDQTNPTNRRLRLLDRTLAILEYSVVLLRDICVSSVDVARRVLDPDLPIAPGIIAVSVQLSAEESASPVADSMAAISAHGITITPGELVVDFEGNNQMFVHCLDVNASSAAAQANQARRMVLLRRIFG
jgi:multicomponent Na+:H+ antiporter subunit E